MAFDWRARRPVPAVLALVLALASSLAAQSTEDKRGKDQANVAEPRQLQSRLDALDQELANERSAIQARRDLFAKELHQLRDRRAALAGRLLAAQLRRERSAAQRAAVREKHDHSTAAAKSLSDEAASLAVSLRDAIEQLRLHLQEVPGTDATVARLRQIASELSALNESNRLARGPKLLLEVFETIGAAHRESTAITVASQEIFTASGKRETVNLLRLGHVRFAYQTIPDGRLGLTLASPQGASGYRWSENINSATSDLLRQAFAACHSGQAGWVSVPVEPTGRLPLDEVRGGQSLSQWFIAGGSVMYPIAAVALASVVLIVERSIFFFVRNRNANRTAAEVVHACAARRFDDALVLLRQKPGVVTRVLDACLKRREAGQRAMEDAIQEQLLQEQPGLRRFMSGLATLAGVAPLLGLLGTVTGIIQTFDVIRSFGNANPNLMAGGISEALITTEAGLMIAIPVLVIHSLLRGRANRILADAEYYAATLLTTLVHGGLASPATPRSTDSRRRPAMNGKPHAQPPAAPLVEAAAGSAEVGHE